MQRALLLSSVGLVLLGVVALWLSPNAKDPARQPDSTPPPALALAPERHAQPAPSPVATPTPLADPAPSQAGPLEGYDARATWRAIERAHAAHPEAEPTWAQMTAETIDDYFGQVADKLGSDPDYAEFVPAMRNLNCRSKSCVAELEFSDYETALAYLNMEAESRWYTKFHVTSTTPCPVRQRAVPREPGTHQAPFNVLLHYECE